MIFIDAFFRFTGLGFLTLLIIFSFNRVSESKSYALLILASASLAALLIGFSPGFYQFPIKGYIRFFDIPHLVLIWLFALTLFQKEFNFKPIHFIVMVIYCIPIAIVRLGQIQLIDYTPYWVFILSSIFSVLLVSHLILTILIGKQDDLVEKRRKARNYFVFVVVFVVFGVAVSEILLVQNYLEQLYTVKAIIIWVAIMWTCLWLLNLQSGQIEFINPEINQQITEIEELLLKKLEDKFIIDRVYLNSKLSINDLAEAIGVTPYKLRHLINSKLGFKNFSSYISSYRIEAVKNHLKNPLKRDIPILTIAIESGFNSLAPFNKAFKDSVGITPSEYRKQHDLIN